jgi:hypothetical protein
MKKLLIALFLVSQAHAYVSFNVTEVGLNYIYLENTGFETLDGKLTIEILNEI